ncbi:MAG: alcohol dehydrogenase catalytic domain-containing protein [Deltaproteobacteria bacterium]|nr:alcohol dehydrogenase catalytic domain-containing protein [Deltaproteobacteria bacterium]
MKVAVYEGVRSIRLQERPKPKAAPGEVIVKIKYCGICGTDVHAYLHEGLLQPGLILGHENVGTIDEIGEGVEGWKLGERVVAGPPGLCGECYYCKHGYPTLCETGFSRTNGLAPGHDGGMAEYMRVREPKTMLHRIPDEVPSEDAVLVDIMAVGLRGILQSKFKLGDNVVVVGAGAIGLCVVQWLKLGGARHITVIQPSQKKREFALKLSADVGLNPLEEGAAIREKVMALYGGIGADIVYECAGTNPAIKTSLELTKSGGQVMLLGVNEEETPFVEALLIQRETEIKTSLAYGEDEIRLCLDFLAQRRFKTEGMVSDIIGLDDIVEKGFERLASTKGLVKVLLAP